MTADKTVQAAAIQWDIRRGEVAHNLEQATEYLEAASRDGVELAVLPEMWGSSFMGEEAASVRAAVDDAERKVRQLSADLGMMIAGSNYEFGSDGSIFNRATLFDRGETLGEYRKIHLFTPQGEDRFFCHGDSALVVDTRFGRIGLAICYDIRFPELTRHLYLEGAEILIVPAQWPEPREGHWRILARARAIENQWFVVAANRCGVEPSLVSDQDIVYPGNSMLIDPTGAVLAEGNGTAGIFADELELKATAIIRRAIPVGKDRQVETYERLRSTTVDDCRR